jgi:hypothetical protein
VGGIYFLVNRCGPGAPGNELDDSHFCGIAGLGHFPSSSMNQYAPSEGYCRQQAN